MKIANLTKAKSGLIGSKLPETKNLSVHPDFPELVLKRSDDIKAAVHYGGILIDCGGKGVLFFACTDPRQLLEIELVYPNSGLVSVKQGNLIFTNSSKLSYYRAELTGSDDASAEPTKVAEADIVKWCAVLTPCNGYGYVSPNDPHIKVQANKNLNVTVGPVFPDSTAPASTGISSQYANNSMNSTKSALVLWREMPTGKTFGALSQAEGFYDRLLAEYPDSLREAAAQRVREHVSAISSLGASVIVSYTRGKGETDKHVGIGLTNQFKIHGGTVSGQVTSSFGIQAWSSVPALEPTGGTDPAKPFTVLPVPVIDCGFRSLTKSGLRQWNVMPTPRPEFGYKLGAGVLPSSIYFDEIELNMKGFLRDFLPTSKSAEIDLFFNEKKIDSTALPAITLGTDTESAALAKSAGRVVTRDPVFGHDYLTHVVNVLARTDCDLGGGVLMHRRANRIYASKSSSQDKSATTQYVVVFPGSRWDGTSKIGGQISFAAGNDITFSVRYVKYGGLVYQILDLLDGGKLRESLAEACVGSAVGESSAQAEREVYLHEGKSYGVAATASAAAAAGGLFKLKADKWILVKEIPVSTEADITQAER